MELIVMRLKNMHRVHPKQDNSRSCPDCGHQVGIYPSGQAVLRRSPTMPIICDVCFAARPEAPLTLRALAPGAVEELDESVPAARTRE
jgi:hypothetical protein